MTVNEVVQKSQKSVGPNGAGLFFVHCASSIFEQLASEKGGTTSFTHNTVGESPLCCCLMMIIVGDATWSSRW